MSVRADDVMVIGGGLVGLATAYKLALARPGLVVRVIEKEDGVGRHQSGHNSGVLHAGLSYKPGSFKARMAVDGIRQMTAFCEAHGVPHEVCGKVVVATHDEELPRLREMLDRGRQNGLCGLEWLEPERLREIEPHAAGVAAVLVPEEGIADYPRVCTALADEIVAHGGSVATGALVRSLRRTPRTWVAETTAGEYEATLLVNCAGLHSDRVATMAGETVDMRIVPFRGEYHALRADRRFLVRNLIYPVPDPAFPFLGVHFTRRTQGGIEAGPNAVLAFAREGYSKSIVSVPDLADALAFPGLWRFLAKYPAMCWRELRRSFSRELFAVALQRLVPEVRAEDLVPGGAGVRAQAVLPSGAFEQDFRFLARPAAFHVLNAPSPGATASLAIADEIVRSWFARTAMGVLD
ncbi:MAG TPA: L-2-hydroxyglutarate oxidase [Gemmatimonadaceae bacterium]